MLGKHSVFVSIKKTIFSLARRRLLPVVPTLEGQKHEDEKFEVIPSYTVTLSLTWVMSLARDTKCLVLLGFCCTFDGVFLVRRGTFLHSASWIVPQSDPRLPSLVECVQ